MPLSSSTRDCGSDAAALPTATPNATAPAGAVSGASGWALLLRALRAGVGAVLLLTALAWFGGVFPDATAGYALAGIAAALVAAALALWLHGRFLDARLARGLAPEGQQLSGQLQGLLGVAFGAKLAVLVLGMLYLHRTFPSGDGDAKFAATASSCIAFAAASLVCQLATAGYLARTLSRRRTVPPGVASGATPDRLVGEPRR